MSTDGFVSANPGRDLQRDCTARFLGGGVAKIHGPVWGVTGSLGDSPCYLGVPRRSPRSKRRCRSVSGAKSCRSG